MPFININETHFTDIANIYEEGIHTGMATFETTVPNWDTWHGSHLPFARIAISKNNQIFGWAALSPISNRHVYRGVAEVSVYVSKLKRGQGLGKKLLIKLIEVSEAHQIWTLQASIMRANQSSLYMHEACGFRIIGFKEKIGKLNDVWLDNIIMEKRSNIVGIN